MPALPTWDTIKADADAVFSMMVGPMALQFPKQLRQSGYTKPVVGGGTSYDEAALPFMGDEAIGDVSALQYSAGLQTPNAPGLLAKPGKCGVSVLRLGQSTPDVLPREAALRDEQWHDVLPFSCPISAIEFVAYSA